MLRIENLKKTFPIGQGKVQALQGVSFVVSEGEFFSLLGPSGSGKSTALRCVAGLERPESGEIFIDGMCVYSSATGVSVPPDERPIGMVFQSYAIWPHQDVFQNVAFPLLYGSKGPRPSKAQIRESVLEALRLVQMEAYHDRPSTQLSGGQQQRVALARALVRKPKVLLLDEPLSNLDAKLREEMRVELKELTRSLGITSFFVTHDQLEALAMSERIGVIMEGKLVEIGEPHAVYTHTQNQRVATFLGAANTLPGRVTQVTPQATLETPLGALSVRGANGIGLDENTWVAIRPEAIMCSRHPEALPNTYAGKVTRAIFLGSFVDGEVQIREHTLRVNLNPYDDFGLGDDIYIHIPAERCQIVS